MLKFDSLLIQNRDLPSLFLGVAQITTNFYVCIQSGKRDSGIIFGVLLLQHSHFIVFNLTNVLQCFRVGDVALRIISVIIFNFGLQVPDFDEVRICLILSVGNSAKLRRFLLSWNLRPVGYAVRLQGAADL